MKHESNLKTNEGEVLVTLNFVLSKVSDTRRHQLIEVSSLDHYCIYNNRPNQAIICDKLEKLGFSVRVGLRHNYASKQGLQVIVFELSKNLTFKYRFTDDYKHPIDEDTNALPPSYPNQFNVGTVIRTNSGLSDGNNGLWLVVGGTRNVMDMNSGYTMPACDANRWLSCYKVHEVRVKKLKPKVYANLQLYSEVYDSHLVDSPILPRDIKLKHLKEPKLIKPLLSRAVGFVFKLLH